MIEQKKKAFDKSFEEKIPQAILLDNLWAEQIFEVLDTNLFDQLHTKKIIELIKEYYLKYEKFPSVSLLENIINTDVADVLLQKKCCDFITNMKTSPLNGDLDYVRDKSLEYFRLQNIARCLSDEILPRIEGGKGLDDIVSLIQSSVNKGTSRDIGYEYEEDQEKRFIDDVYDKVPSGFSYFDDLLSGGFGAKRLFTCIAPAGCHEKGTEIILHDGSFKKVEDVEVGDVLMGPDSKSRNVLRLFRGREQMYEVFPVKGKSFVVNESHILSLRRGGKCNDGSNVKNISVIDYINAKNIKEYKLYKSDAITFENEQKLPIHPYTLGVVLGEKNTTAKRFIFKDIGASYLGDKLTKLGLMGKKSVNKFIPHMYKTSSIKNRSEILAGLIDTDGHYTNNIYEYVSKSSVLVNDVAFISNSLGLATTIREKIVSGVIYYRVFISGNIDIIPVKLERKKARPRLQIKNVLHTGIEKIVKKNVDDYYGFELDQDHLYLVNDFTVHHNSGKSHILINFGRGALLSPKKDGTGRVVVHYTLELDTIDVARRYDASITGIKINDVVGNKNKILLNVANQLPRGAKLIIKEYPIKNASVQTIKSHLARLKLKGIVPDVIIIDYGDLLRPVEGADGEKRHGLEHIWQDMKRLAQEQNVPVLTVTQTNRTGYSADLITPDQVSEDFSKIMTSDIILTLARNLEQKALGIGKALLAKNRQDKDGQIFAWSIKTETCCIDMFELTADVQQKMDEANGEAELNKNEEVRMKLAQFTNNKKKVN